jgi:hypothetical protein
LPAKGKKNDYGKSYYLKKLKRFEKLVDEVVGVKKYILNRENIVFPKPHL